MGEKTGRIVRNGVVVNNHTRPVGPTVAVPAPVPAAVLIEAPAPAPAAGTPFLAASVPRNNTFLIDTNQQFVEMVVRLAQNSDNVLSAVVLPSMEPEVSRGI